jgi:FAD/FMN-containing dehydrogenase/Fe-S oxidoreductase
MAWTEDLAAQLGRHIRGEVRTDPMTRALYSTDASIYQAMPLAAVIPRHPDDVRATMEFAAAHGLPLLPRGGGTSLEGQTINEALIVDCSPHLNQVLEVNAEEGWARVQPGVVQDGLSHHVAHLGMKFGPDTATSNRATIGGMMGNNSAGTRSIVYGKTIDHVLEVRCILFDGTEVVFGELDAAGWQAKQKLDGVEGSLYRTVAAVLDRNRNEIENRFPKIMRHVCGFNLDYLLHGDTFNLAHLMVGSEGTLGIILDAKVRIVPRPKATAIGLINFDSLVDAMEATRLIVPTGPSAVELLGRIIIEQARSHPTLSRLCGFMEGDPEGILIVEYSGENGGEVVERVEQIRQTLESSRLGYGFHAAVTPEAQGAVWKVRKAGLALMLAVKGDAKPIAFVEDSAVAVDSLPAYVQRLQQVVADHDTHAGFYGHASVGCLHFRPIINCKKAEDIEKLRSIADDIRDLVVEFDGSMSGEHGDGRTRTEYLPGFFGPQIYDAFRQIKTVLDPEGRLNPGNICNPYTAAEAAELSVERQPSAGPPIPHAEFKIDTDLRYGTEYQADDLGRFLDWSREGSLIQHIEMCNGNGSCRKLDAGTMCPSYMATMDEEHSTRGRANALRSVLSGTLSPDGFADKRLYDVLDLCLECKGCKGECPSNVDMAKIKYEFLAQYYEAHGTPRRAKLFGHVARASRWGSRLAPLSNWVGGSWPGRWVNEKLLGIVRHRPLPPFRRQTFEAWFYARNGGGRAARGEGPSPRGEVVLFHDTFMNHNYPEIGRAAVKVLEAAGYDVVLVNKVCCGRPMLSNGLADDAREHARINVERLVSYARRGIPILGCEPSCLMMLREDYLDLLPGNQGAEDVAAQSFLIEEFLTEAAAKDPEDFFSETLRRIPKELLVHGHCHQKASTSMGPTLELLGWVPGYEISELDAGCCGMAGSFGYKSETYDLSMAIGERVLFKALREHPGAGVALSGVSCRQQVLHGTGRAGRHPIEWLADALGD